MHDPVGYRAAALLCPQCERPLRPISVPGAEVDRCDDCHGAWFDWLDGDGPELARSLGPTGDDPAEDPAIAAPLAGPCPRCARPLEAESFLGTGPRVQRCPGCQGMFVPASSLAALAALGARFDDPAPASFWARLQAALRRLLHA